eukprot:g62499.t1
MREWQLGLVMFAWTLQHLVMTTIREHLKQWLSGSDFFYLLLRATVNAVWYGAGVWMYRMISHNSFLYVGGPQPLAYTFRMVGVAVIVGSFFTPTSPMDIRIQRRYGLGVRDFPTQQDQETMALPWGISKVVRHLQFWGISLICISCLINQVYLADWLYWGAILLLIIIGVPRQEARHRANPKMAVYFAETHFWPTPSAFLRMSRPELRSLAIAAHAGLLAAMLLTFVPVLYAWMSSDNSNVAIFVAAWIGVILIDNFFGAVFKCQFLPSHITPMHETLIASASAIKQGSQDEENVSSSQVAEVSSNEAGEYKAPQDADGKDPRDGHVAIESEGLQEAPARPQLTQSDSNTSDQSVNLPPTPDTGADLPRPSSLPTTSTLDEGGAMEREEDDEASEKLTPER